MHNGSSVHAVTDNTVGSPNVKGKMVGPLLWILWSKSEWWKSIFHSSRRGLYEYFNKFVYALQNSARLSWCKKQNNIPINNERDPFPMLEHSSSHQIAMSGFFTGFCHSPCIGSQAGELLLAEMKKSKKDLKWHKIWPMIPIDVYMLVIVLE